MILQSSWLSQIFEEIHFGSKPDPLTSKFYASFPSHTFEILDVNTSNVDGSKPDL